MGNGFGSLNFVSGCFWVVACLDFQFVAVERDDFACADFGGFARFGCAVTLHLPCGNQGFGLPAALGKPCEFEQVAQGDVVLVF